MNLELVEYLFLHYAIRDDINGSEGGLESSNQIYQLIDSQYLYDTVLDTLAKFDISLISEEFNHIFGPVDLKGYILRRIEENYIRIASKLILSQEIVKLTK